MALNNQQWLICHKTKPNVFRVMIFFYLRTTLNKHEVRCKNVKTLKFLVHDVSSNLTKNLVIFFHPPLQKSD